MGTEDIQRAADSPSTAAVFGGLFAWAEHHKTLLGAATGVLLAVGASWMSMKHEVSGIRSDLDAVRIEVKTQCESLRKRIDASDIRIDKGVVEQQAADKIVVEIRNDIRWIRETLQRREARP